MAKVGFNAENKTKTFEGFPKFRLETGEKARICLIDSEPECAYVHTLRAPVVRNGQIVKETKTGSRGDWEADKTEFVGQYVCSGDFDTVSDKGTDPANCTLCAEVKAAPDKFQLPQRRFAQNILRYKTKPGSFNLAEPFQAEIVAWVYSEKKFDQLVDIAEQWADDSDSDMRKIDLMAGPCISKDFQNFELAVAKDCAWLQSEDRKKFTTDVYKANRCEDLEDLIGRNARTAASYAAIDVDKVKGRWAMVGDPAAQETDIQTMEDLMSRGDTAPPAFAAETSTEPEKKASGKVDFEDNSKKDSGDDLDFEKMLDEVPF